ncbi:MAG TPA: hypothetical protein VHF26_12420 [Trebonia sp.]|nr:hypothetical protein [Trebonia sp.]
MLGHAAPGNAVFAACQRLFRAYPLAVRRHYAEHRYGSMVLMNGVHRSARFLVLIMEWDDRFVLRHWDRRHGARVQIGPDTPVSGDVRALIEASVPVPRDGTLLGWVAGGQVQALLAAYGRLPEPWDDASAVPGMLVMPLVGTQPASWPPLVPAPLGDGRLWDFIQRGQLADIGPLVSRHAGRVFWVPGRSGVSGRAGARVLVTERLSDDRCWLPAGVYADHRMLREGTPVQTARQLLALPGVTDLAGSRGQHLLGV